MLADIVWDDWLRRRAHGQGRLRGLAGARCTDSSARAPSRCRAEAHLEWARRQTEAGRRPRRGAPSWRRPTPTTATSWVTSRLRASIRLTVPERPQAFGRGGEQRANDRLQALVTPTIMRRNVNVPSSGLSGGIVMLRHILNPLQALRFDDTRSALVWDPRVVT